ncbi:MAG: DUF6600 domain-containing protein, partial [Burkholderiales bacterium]
WGWTWVDDAPWGFAPFHYGRWVNVRNTWCWTPGQRVVRPVYAPALVAWVGGPRANVSITIGGGPAVGWFPLAPREVYVPSYRVTPRYAHNINITHVTNVTVINNVFANPQGRRDFDNRRFPNAVTVVPAGVMTSRQPVAPAAAQMRKNPAAREFINQPPARAVALIAPPVAAPAARRVDPRAVRPPPGLAERPVVARPGFQPPQDRERDGRGRDLNRPETLRPAAPIPQPAAPAAPVVTPAVPAAPAARVVTPAAPVVTPAAPRPMPPANVGERRDDRRDGRGDDRRRDAVPPPPTVSPQPAPAPVARPAAPAAQEGPMMRPQPVRRGEERRDQPRPPEVAPGRNEARPPPAVRVERPAPAVAPAAPAAPAPRPVAPAPRPVEPPRAVQAHPAPAPVPAPGPAPDVKRPEQRPQQRAEPPANEPKRVDPREQQR